MTPIEPAPMNGLSTPAQASLYQQLRGHLATLKLHDAAEHLPAVLDAAHTEGLTVTAALERLLQIEVEATEARRLTGRLRFASLPTPATLADFDYDAAAPGLDRHLLDPELGPGLGEDPHRGLDELGPALLAVLRPASATPVTRRGGRAPRRLDTLGHGARRYHRLRLPAVRRTRRWGYSVYPGHRDLGRDDDGGCAHH